LKIGDLVKHKRTGFFGIINYSTFGCSVHFYDEETNTYGKTLGTIFEDVEKYWEVTDELPDDYIVSNGFVVRKNHEAKMF
jgi:hypothetical protein